jgi:hypothetical protein
MFLMMCNQYKKHLITALGQLLNTGNAASVESCGSGWCLEQQLAAGSLRLSWSLLAGAMYSCSCLLHRLLFMHLAVCLLTPACQSW